MFVQSTSPAGDLRGGRIPATAPVTYVSLSDLLGGEDGHAAERQSLIALLQKSGKLTARVVETRADGLSVLEFGPTRAALKLAGTPALGDLLTVMLAGAAEPEASAKVSLSRPAALLHGLENNKLNHILTTDPTIEPLVDIHAAPRTLASALQHALRDSGLFYESHLRGWLDGHADLRDIRNEPQARLMEHASASAGDAGELLPPRLEYLVRQQLDVLARNTIEWHGLAWPGQQASIAIHDETAHEPNEQAERNWRVRLELTVPTLGPVCADLRLAGNRLSVQLNGDAAATPALRHARADLAAALGALDSQGVSVAPIHIGQGE